MTKRVHVMPCIVLAIMRRLITCIFVIAAIAGCKGFKESQHDAYVGDTQTKIFYKNVGANISKVPEGNRTFFKTVDEATEKGYTSFNEAGKMDEGDED